MATAVGALDDAIREYLVFRGFTNTLKQFESEKKDDKDKNFRVKQADCTGKDSFIHEFLCMYVCRSVELWITCYNA